MDLVYNDLRTTQDSNAALVIVYNNNNVIGFHDDAESFIDSQSSVSIINFSSSRTVESCDH